MKLREFTTDGERAHAHGPASALLRARADARSCFPHSRVAILDSDFSDEDGSEPDGVNDFVHRLGSEQLDQQ